MTARPVQTSLIEGMERPIGPLPLSVQTGTNADVMFAIKDLYLTGSVLDVTYGKGKWWDRFKPEPFTAHDLYTLDGVDFRALPEADSSVDTVCFDPPYVMSGGPATQPGAAQLRASFGIDGYRSEVEFRALLLDGFTEVLRVARRFVLVKCMEAVGSGRLTDMPHVFKGWAHDAGAGFHDQIVHHTGVGPGGHNIYEPIRCRRAHSYLLVFEVAA